MLSQRQPLGQPAHGGAVQTVRTLITRLVAFAGPAAFLAIEAAPRLRG